MTEEDLTSNQKLFILLCRRMEIPLEQPAIYMRVLSDEDLGKVLHWLSAETKKKGRLLRAPELTAHLVYRVHKKNKKELY